MRMRIPGLAPDGDLEADEGEDSWLLHTTCCQNRPAIDRLAKVQNSQQNIIRKVDQEQKIWKEQEKMMCVIEGLKAYNIRVNTA